MKTIKPINIILAALCVAISPLRIASAASRDEIGKATVRNAEGMRSLPVASSDKTPKPIDLRFLAKIRGQGVLPIRLRSSTGRYWKASFSSPQGDVEDNQPIALVSGTIGVRSKWHPGSVRARRDTPIAGSITATPGGKLFVNLAYIAETIRGRERVVEISGYLEEDKLDSKQVPLLAFSGKACGLRVDSENHLHPATALAATAVPASFRSIEISTDTDFEFFQRWGNNSNSKIAGYIQQATVIYREQLGLTFQLVQQKVVNSSSGRYKEATDFEELLDIFTEYTNTNNHLGNADLYHLFSGKSITTGVIGLAYLGVTCSSPTFSFGTTLDFNSTLTHVTFAHEVGHNFNANHDNAAPGIMNASLDSSNPPTSFSTRSRNEIATYLSDSSNSGCLAVVNDDNTPTPTATPTPRVTPTPGGPTPTPAPTSNGPGGIQPGDPTNVVGLSVSLKKTGLLNVGVSLGVNPDPSCLLTIRGASSSAKAASSSASVLATLVPTQSSITLSGVVPARTAAFKRSKQVKVFLSANYFCPNGERSSGVKGVKTGTVKRASRPVSVNTWINLAGSVLEPQ